MRKRARLRTRRQQRGTRSPQDLRAPGAPSRAASRPSRAPRDRREAHVIQRKPLGPRGRGDDGDVRASTQHAARGVGPQRGADLARDGHAAHAVLQAHDSAVAARAHDLLWRLAVVQRVERRALVGVRDRAHLGDGWAVRQGDGAPVAEAFVHGDDGKGTRREGEGKLSRQEAEGVRERDRDDGRERVRVHDALVLARPASGGWQGARGSHWARRLRRRETAPHATGAPARRRPRSSAPTG
jgi:hypothetical protein